MRWSRYAWTLAAILLGFAAVYVLLIAVTLAVVEGLV